MIKKISKLGYNNPTWKSSLREKKIWQPIQILPRWSSFFYCCRTRWNCQLPGVQRILYSQSVFLDEANACVWKSAAFWYSQFYKTGNITRAHSIRHWKKIGTLLSRNPKGGAVVTPLPEIQSASDILSLKCTETPKHSKAGYTATFLEANTFAINPGTAFKGIHITSLHCTGFENCGPRNSVASGRRVHSFEHFSSGKW